MEQDPGRGVQEMVVWAAPSTLGQWVCRNVAGNESRQFRNWSLDKQRQVK